MVPNFFVLCNPWALLWYFVDPHPSRPLVGKHCAWGFYLLCIFLGDGGGRAPRRNLSRNGEKNMQTSHRKASTVWDFNSQLSFSEARTPLTRYVPNAIIPFTHNWQLPYRLVSLHKNQNSQGCQSNQMYEWAMIKWTNDNISLKPLSSVQFSRSLWLISCN